MSDYRSCFPLELGGRRYPSAPLRGTIAMGADETMTSRGTVQNGVVVLEAGVTLPDGARVVLPAVCDMAPPLTACAGPARSALGDLQLAPDVKAGAFLDHKGRHRPAPFRLDL